MKNLIRIFAIGFLLTINQYSIINNQLKAQVTVEPSDDMVTETGGSTYTVASDELVIANKTGTMVGDNFHRTMLKFDLSQYSGETITSATLNLYKWYGAPDGTETHGNIYAITEDWDESTWPTDQNVSHETTETTTYNFGTNADVNTWKQIDITALVQSWLDGSVTDYGLVIVALSGHKFCKFYSKEHSDANKHPYLEIDGINSIEDNNKKTGYPLTTYPNPFNSSIKINFSITSPCYTKLSVYNLLGEEVKSLINKNLTTGSYSNSFDVSDLQAGVYFVHLQVGNEIYTRKIVSIN